MASSDHRHYVKSYLRRHKNGAEQQEPLKSRYPSRSKNVTFNDIVADEPDEKDFGAEPAPDLNDPRPAQLDEPSVDQSPEFDQSNSSDASIEAVDLHDRPRVMDHSPHTSMLEVVQKQMSPAVVAVKSTAPGKKPHAISSNKAPVVRPKTGGRRNQATSLVKAPLRKYNTSQGLLKNPTLISLPDELQLRILSYLSPGDLLVCARVCKHWNYLANDNVLWKALFDKISAKKSKMRGKGQAKLKDREQSFQYWKWQCVKRCTEDRNQVLKLLSKIDNYTGLPKHTDKCLQTLAVQWRLSFVDRDGVETYIDHRDVFYHRISISVRWYDLEMPPVNRMKVLRLYAACPVFFENNKPMKNSACQMSLLYEFDLDWSKVISRVHPVATDERIDLRILSPLMIATWKDGGEIAFISACLHNNNLVEVCLEANRRRAALQIMRRPKPAAYSNMFGYNITLELRNQRQSCWSDQHRSIYFDKDQIAAGKALLNLISSDHNFKHTPIRSKLEMPWKTDIFKNILKNVTILDIVLQDEQNKPVWCVSTPVNVAKPDGATSVVYDYDGDFSFIDFKDGVGHLHMELVWEEEIGHFMLTCLQVELNLSAIGMTVYGLQ